MLKQKVVSIARLQTILKKQKKKKVVFTNGVFDIVHAGHVTYLERARALGDILVVALNSDESTSRLKGPTRPINGLKDRMLVIAALESVSYVVSFSEDTPIKPISKILPHILVKGGDYDVKKIVGYKEVTENGGKVRVIRFLEGRSTTAIATKIKSN